MFGHLEADLGGGGGAVPLVSPQGDHHFSLPSSALNFNDGSQAPAPQPTTSEVCVNDQQDLRGMELSTRKYQ